MKHHAARYIFIRQKSEASALSDFALLNFLTLYGKSNIVILETYCLLLKMLVFRIPRFKAWTYQTMIHDNNVEYITFDMQHCRRFHSTHFIH